MLKLASGSSNSGVAADAPLAIGRSAAESSYRLVGPLPSGPDQARAHPLPRGAATAGDVSRLAGALGVTDPPKRVEGGWQAGALRVRDDAGNPWSMYAGCAPDVLVSPPNGAVSSDGAVSSGGTVSSDGTVSSGGVAICSSGIGEVGPGSVSSGSGGSGSGGSGSGGSGSVNSGHATTTMTVAPAPPPAPVPAPNPCPPNATCAKPPVATLPPTPALPSPGPTVDLGAAREAAKLVLADLGLADADVSAQGGGEQAYIQAAPRIGGLRTSGYDTSLQINADGHVVGGNGYLARPTDGPSYPLVTAAAAFDALPELPRPMYACPVNARCPGPQPTEITGAELGLMLTPLADNEAALLPAWLFTLKGWPTPVAQAAIEPRFLSLPKPVRIDPGPGLPVPPAAPPQQVEPAGPRSAFGFDAAFPTDEPNIVIVQYGDSGSCPHTNVQPLVKESADSIVVTLEGDAQSTKRACTDDYRQQLVTLKLAAPLGNRTVIDGSRSQPVAVDRTCARPMGQPTAPKSCKG